LDTVHLRDFLATKLPDYMIPNGFVTMPAFPLSPNGKTNRKALPRLEINIPIQAYEAPRTNMEWEIAGIWADMLKIDQVGIHDNFFQLGGHSLIATQIVSRLREQLLWEVPLRAFFDVPTIAGIVGQYPPPELPDLDDLDELMAEFDDLSPEELELLMMDIE
jgi:acyl carrier protein